MSQVRVAPKTIPRKPGTEELLKSLADLGCSTGTQNVIASHLKDKFASESERAAKLERIIEFAQSIGSDAASQYFYAVGSAKAVSELTDQRVLSTSEFIKSMGSNTVLQYFLAIGATKAVAELTDRRILTFAQSLGSDAAYRYFQAIGATKAVAELTDQRILTFAQSLGTRAAQRYFQAMGLTGAVSELTDQRVLSTSEFIKSMGSNTVLQYFLAIGATKAVAELTDQRILTFAQSIGSDAAYWYFLVISETKAVSELTDQRVLSTSEFIKSLGSDAAGQYCWAIGLTGAVAELTDQRILTFAQSLGSDAAGQYFWAIGVTKAVSELTDQRVLSTSEFIKSIGSYAAEQYFRAIAITKAVAELTDASFLEWFSASKGKPMPGFPVHLAEPLLSKAIAVGNTGDKFNAAIQVISWIGSPAIPGLLKLVRNGAHEEQIIAGSALYVIGGPFVEVARDQIEAMLQSAYPTSEETRERSRHYMNIARAFGKGLAAEFGEGNVIVTVVGSTQKGLAAKGSDIDCNVHIFSGRSDARKITQTVGERLHKETNVDISPSIIVFPTRQNISEVLAMRMLQALVSPYLVAYGDLKTAGEIWFEAARRSPFEGSIMKEKYGDRAMGDLERAEKLIKGGRYDEAIRIYEYLLTHYPNDENVRRLLEEAKAQK